MAEKWSDAPWRVGLGAGAVDVVSADGYILAEWVSLEDAYLIAAAPELYEALREMVYETTNLSPQEDDGLHWCKISEEALACARAALAKARGETS